MMAIDDDENITDADPHLGSNQEELGKGEASGNLESDDMSSAAEPNVEEQADALDFNGRAIRRRDQYLTIFSK